MQSTSGDYFQHETIVNVVGSVRILDEGWFSSDEFHCVRMGLGLESLPANITLEDPLWSLVQGTSHPIIEPMNVTLDSPELVCIEPFEGAIQMSENSSNGGILGPIIRYQSDNGSSLYLTAPLLDVNRSVVVFPENFRFGPELPFVANAIGWNLNQSSHCPESPTKILEDNFEWAPNEFDNHSQIVHFSDEINNGSLNLFSQLII